MPTTYTTENLRYINSFSLNACTGTATPTYNTALFKTRTVTLPNVEHRTKPSDLVRNPTSRTWSEYNVQKGILDAHRKVLDVLCVATGKKTNFTYTTQSLFQPSVVLPTPSLPNTNLKLRTKIDDLDLNLGGYIGEYDQTAGMFTSGARLLSNAWKLAHGRLPKSKKHYRPRDVSAAWLNTQFAIKPTVDDIFSAIDILNNSASRPVRRKITARETSADGGTILTGNYSIDWEREISIKDSIYIERNSNHSYFNLGNPAEWVWEAIPFSFVIDWFIPIGSYINSFDSMKNWSVVGGTSVKRDRYKITGTLNQPSTSLIDYYTSSPYTATGDSFVRSVKGSVGFPQVPKLKNPFSTTHVLDALALLHLMKK